MNQEIIDKIRKLNIKQNLIQNRILQILLINN
jgi:hypothetical protein